MITPLPLACEVSLAALVVVAAVYDIRFRRIPNWLALAGFSIALILNTAILHLAGLERAALGAGLALALYLPLFALRAMGGGDVKLMVAIGAFTGPGNWIVLFLITAITGGIIAVFLLLFRGGLTRALRNVLLILGELVRLRSPHRAHPALDVAHPGAVTLPHAVSIAVGTILFLVFEKVSR